MVIPKTHYRWVYEVPNFGEYWEVAKKITQAMQKSLNPYFITYVTHGLEVEHAHLHILPRYRDDVSFVPDEKTFSREEFGQISEKIKNSL